MLFKLNLAVAVFLAAIQSQAMCVTKSFEPIAWNAKGSSVLIREIQNGPEGGGANTYLILEFDKGAAEVFQFSLNFGPGGSDAPEKIPAEKCAENLKNANAVLAQEGFSIKLPDDAKQCQTPRGHMLPDGADNDGRLDRSQSSEIEKLLDKSLLKKLSVIASKDHSRYVVIDANSSCNAKCYRFIKSRNGKSMRKVGECR